MALSRIQYPSPGFSQHWQQPAGKNMLRKIKTLPSTESITTFNALYLQCDEQADQVVKDLFTGRSHKEGHTLLKAVLDKGPDAVEYVPDSLRQLYLDSLIIPSWLNEGLMKSGVAFCQRTSAL